MIAEVTGIRTIRMLYLQLLYRCNFACQHCFHGERLQYADAFTLDQAITLMRLVHKEYGTEAVNLLGGEPFVYKDLPEVVRYAKRELGLRVEICTNAPNIDEVLPLARTLQDHGARQLKLHHLRPVGNAAHHPELLVTDTAAYGRLREQLRTADLTIEVIVDEDLTEEGAPETCTPAPQALSIPRIEADPRGALTMSCNAVGKDAHAFWYDKEAGHIVHRPSATDEIALAVPGVIYARA